MFAQKKFLQLDDTVDRMNTAQLKHQQAIDGYRTPPEIMNMRKTIEDKLGMDDVDRRNIGKPGARRRRASISSSGWARKRP